MIGYEIAREGEDCALCEKAARVVILEHPLCRSHVMELRMVAGDAVLATHHQ